MNDVKFLSYYNANAICYHILLLFINFFPGPNHHLLLRFRLAVRSGTLG